MSLDGPATQTSDSVAVDGALYSIFLGSTAQRGMGGD